MFNDFIRLNFFYPCDIKGWRVSVENDESYNEDVEVLIVSLPNAVPKPNAVMVKIFYAVVTMPTMRRSRWPPNPACIAKLGLANFVVVVVIDRF